MIPFRALLVYLNLPSGISIAKRHRSSPPRTLYDLDLRLLVEDHAKPQLLAERTKRVKHHVRIHPQ
jgi:hypothetical protein